MTKNGEGQEVTVREFPENKKGKKIIEENRSLGRNRPKVG